MASRVDAQTRSILARAKINNENLEILPGSLLEIEILYNEKNALSIPDTALIMEGNKKFVYQVIENNMIKKTEIETGVRDQENLEVLEGLTQGDKVVAEGLTKVRPNMKIKTHYQIAVKKIHNVYHRTFNQKASRSSGVFNDTCSLWLYLFFRSFQ